METSVFIIIGFCLLVILGLYCSYEFCSDAYYEIELFEKKNQKNRLTFYKLLKIRKNYPYWNELSEETRIEIIKKNLENTEN